MSRTVGFSLNKNEKITLMHKFGVEESELGKFIKQLVLSDLDFQQARNKINPSLEEMSIDEVKKIAPDLTVKQLKEFLGINEKRRPQNAVARSGLHFEHNLESYLDNFKKCWNGVLERVPELCFTVKLIAKEEILARELSNRGS